MVSGPMAMSAPRTRTNRTYDRPVGAGGAAGAAGVVAVEVVAVGASVGVGAFVGVTESVSVRVSGAAVTLAQRRGARDAFHPVPHVSRCVRSHSRPVSSQA